jgi:hypothetical protein
MTQPIYNFPQSENNFDNLQRTSWQSMRSKTPVQADMMPRVPFYGHKPFSNWRIA